jgi:hypothetical protein
MILMLNRVKRFVNSFENIKEDGQEGTRGTVSLPGKYGKGMEEHVWKYRAEQLTLAGLRCKIGLG